MLYRNFRGKGGLILLEIAWVLRVQHAPVCEIPLSLETPVNWEELHSRRSLHAGEPLLICNVWNESTAALIWEILCNKKYMPCSSVSGSSTAGRTDCICSTLRHVVMHQCPLRYKQWGYLCSSQTQRWGSHWLGWYRRSVVSVLWTIRARYAHLWQMSRQFTCPVGI